MKSIKALLQILAIALLFALVLEGGLPFTMILLTFAMGLAIARPSMWLRWSIVFVIASAALIASVIFVQPHLPKEGIVAGVITVGLLPLTPAFYLWLAYLVRLRAPMESAT
jgi:hypothetical protein